MLLEDPTLLPPTTPTRPVVVQKYGGSSVADTDKLGRVADRIVATQRAGFSVVAVVSAMGKTTDGLLKLAKEVAGTSAAPRRELDMLVSTGERVAMSLLSIAIQARGLDAISFTGSQCGIITNDQHFDARIIEVRPHRIEDELRRGRVVIVAGYQGMSYKREITTLGRGGTDTTAVALAAALGAERCEIYSDVDGVYSADPRHVGAASHLPEVDYETLQEMAHAGAKVICAHAVEWARRANIAIYARSTFDAISESPRQTIVRKNPPDAERVARAVSVHHNSALVTCDEAAVVLDELTKANLALSELTLGAGGALLVPLNNCPNFEEVAERLEQAGARVDRDVAVVSIVGATVGTAKRLELLQRVLAEAGIEPKLTTVHSLRISLTLAEADARKVEAILHEAFVAPELAAS